MFAIQTLGATVIVDTSSSKTSLTNTTKQHKASPRLLWHFLEDKFDSNMTNKGKGKQDKSMVKDLMANTAQLDWDNENGVYWPRDMACNTFGCKGKCGGYTLVSHPDNQCWFCDQFFLTEQNRVLVHRFQEKLVSLAGGWEAEVFARSRIAKNLNNPGKGKDFGKGKGPAQNFSTGFVGKPKGKFDKDKGSSRGSKLTAGFKGSHKNQHNSGVDIRTLQQPQAAATAATATVAPQIAGPTGTLAAAFVARLGSAVEKEKEVSEAAASSTHSRASSRARASDTPEPKETVLEWLNQVTTLEELKERVRAAEVAAAANTSGAEDPGQEKGAATLCSQNHQAQTLLAKALKHRETLRQQVKQKQREIDDLHTAYTEQVNYMKQEYRQLRDCLDSEQDRMVKDLQAEKAALVEELQKAQDKLDQVHREHMKFYVELPNTGRQLDMEIEHGIESPTHSPRSGGTEFEENIRQDPADNDGGYEERIESSHSESEDNKDKNKKDKDKKTGGKPKEKPEKKSSKMHVHKGHLKDHGTDSHSGTGTGSKPSGEDDQQNKKPDVSNSYILMPLEERNFVMKAVEQPSLLQDEGYVSNLELALSKHGLSVQAFTQAIQQQDSGFFSRLHTVQPTGAGIQQGAN